MRDTILIEDTRQKMGHHDNVSSFCSERGIRMIRMWLRYGDYALLTVPEWIDDADAWIRDRILHKKREDVLEHIGKVCVDTKFGLSEVYGNLVQEHDRFAAECDGAYADGFRLIVLIEEPCIRSVDDVHTWVNPQVALYEALAKKHQRGNCMGNKLPKRKPVDSPRLERMMKTFAEHHHCEWRFCRMNKTGETLMEILGVNE